MRLCDRRRTLRAPVDGTTGGGSAGDATPLCAPLGLEMMGANLSRVRANQRFGDRRHASGRAKRDTLMPGANLQPRATGSLDISAFSSGFCECMPPADP